MSQSVESLPQEPLCLTNLFSATAHLLSGYVRYANRRAMGSEQACAILQGEEAILLLPYIDSAQSSGLDRIAAECFGCVLDSFVLSANLNSRDRATARG